MWLCRIVVTNLISVIIYDLFLSHLSTFYCCMFWLSSVWHLAHCHCRVLFFSSLPFSTFLLSCWTWSCTFLCHTFLYVPFTLPTPLTGVHSGVYAAVRVCVWIAVTLVALALLGLNSLVPVAMWTFSQLLLPNPLHLSPSTPACKTAWKHMFA